MAVEVREPRSVLHSVGSGGSCPEEEAKWGA